MLGKILYSVGRKFHFEPIIMANNNNSNHRIIYQNGEKLPGPYAPPLNQQPLIWWKLNIEKLNSFDNTTRCIAKNYVTCRWVFLRVTPILKSQLMLISPMKNLSDSCPHMVSPNLSFLFWCRIQIFILSVEYNDLSPIYPTM